MENCKSTLYSYPKAYRFMKKNGARKSHATVPLSIDFCNSAHFALIKVNSNSMEIQFGHFEKIQELEVSFLELISL